jgi:ribonuclease VapC
MIGVTLEPVTLEQGEIAREAFYSFGRGRHSAALNFGDCFAYALAKSRNEKLLFEGNDFGQTDVRVAM